MEENPNLSAVFIRGISFFLGACAQFFTIRDVWFLFLDLSSGSLHPRFYVSLIAMSVLFPLSLWLIFQSMGNSRFITAAINVYAFSLSMISAAYYFAITANYDSIAASFADPVHAHIAMFAIFALPTVGAVLFAQSAGKVVCGIASVPYLATFLYGATAITADLKREKFATYFAGSQIPKLIMLSAILLIGIRLFSTYIAQQQE